MEGKKEFDSGFIMFPPGHARFDDKVTLDILKEKHARLGKLGLQTASYDKLVTKLQSLEKLSNEEVTDLYNCNIKFAEKSIDD